MTNTQNTREFSNRISFNIVNRGNGKHEVVVRVDGTVSSTKFCQEVQVSKSGKTSYATIQITSTNVVDTLKKAFKNDPNVDQVPDDVKYVRIGLTAFNTTNKEGKVVRPDADYLVKKNLQADVWEDHKIKTRGDHVTAVGYIPNRSDSNIRIDTDKNGNKYYTFNLVFVAIFKSGLLSGFVPLVSSLNESDAKNPVWQENVLLRGRLSRDPYVSDDKKRVVLSVAIDSNDNNFKNMEFATQDKDKKLKEHDEKHGYFISATGFGRNAEYLQKRDWHKGDLVEIMGPVTGIYEQDDTKYEPQVQMFVDSASLLRHKKDNDSSTTDGAGSETGAVDPFANGNDPIDLDANEQDKDINNTPDPDDTIDISDEDLPF